MIISMKNRYISFPNFADAISRNFKVFFYNAWLVAASRSLDLEAVKIAGICKISRITINKILKNIRLLMLQACQVECKLSGKIEIDKSYFGAKRVRGKRGRGAAGKHIVFLLHYARSCKQKGLLQASLKQI